MGNPVQKRFFKEAQGEKPVFITAMNRATLSLNKQAQVANRSAKRSWLLQNCPLGSKANDASGNAGAKRPSKRIYTRHEVEYESRI